jgi:adenylate cyclase class 2
MVTYSYSKYQEIWKAVCILERAFKNTYNSEKITVIIILKSLLLKRDLLEVEIKIPLDDILPNIDPREYITNRIGNPIEDVDQIDIYYQNPVKDFHKSDEALRIRQINMKDENISVELTYKGPKTGSEMKVREEITIETSDVEKAKQLIKRLGFKPVMEVKKNRVNWQKNTFILSLDAVENLGHFIEIELQVLDTLSELQGSKKKIRAFAKDLFPSWTGENERRSYLELLMMKTKEKG